MDHATDKLSAAKSIVFRAGITLREQLENLAKELSRPNSEVTISDILREGITVFWPQMRAYLRARNAIGSYSPDALARIVAAASKAGEFGLTPEEAIAALEEATTAKLNQP